MSASRWRWWRRRTRGRPRPPRPPSASSTSRCRRCSPSKRRWPGGSSTCPSAASPAATSTPPWPPRRTCWKGRWRRARRSTSTSRRSVASPCRPRTGRSSSTPPPRARPRSRRSPPACWAGAARTSPWTCRASAAPSAARSGAPPCGRAWPHWPATAPAGRRSWRSSASRTRPGPASAIRTNRATAWASTTRAASWPGTWSSMPTAAPRWTCRWPSWSGACSTPTTPTTSRRPASWAGPAGRTCRPTPPSAASGRRRGFSSSSAPWSGSPGPWGWTRWRCAAATPIRRGSSLRSASRCTTPTSPSSWSTWGATPATRRCGRRTRRSTPPTSTPSAGSAWCRSSSASRSPRPS